MNKLIFKIIQEILDDDDFLKDLITNRQYIKYDIIYETTSYLKRTTTKITVVNKYTNKGCLIKDIDNNNDLHSLTVDLWGMLHELFSD